MPPVARITSTSIAEWFDGHVQDSPCLIAVGSVIIAAIVIIIGIIILDFIFRKSFKEGEPADKNIQQLALVTAIVFVGLLVNNHAVRQKNKTSNALQTPPPPIIADTPDASPQFAEHIARELGSKTDSAIDFGEPKLFVEYA